jgi:hypothetical protein
LVCASAPDWHSLARFFWFVSELVAVKWGIEGLFANYPMALDDANKRLFVGCRLPARLVVLDTTSGRIFTSLPAVGEVAHNIPDEFRVSITNATVKDAYPISSFTWLLVAAKFDGKTKLEAMSRLVFVFVKVGHGADSLGRTIPGNGPIVFSETPTEPRSGQTVPKVTREIDCFSVS